MTEVTMKNLKARGGPQMHLNEMDTIYDKYDVDDDNYLCVKLLPLINSQVFGPITVEFNKKFINAKLW